VSMSHVAQMVLGGRNAAWLGMISEMTNLRTEDSNPWITMSKIEKNTDIVNMPHKIASIVSILSGGKNGKTL
jgi:hypothetical protein